MEPITFPEVNRTWAADGQPDETGKKRYNPLPSYTDDRVTVTCWTLTWRERWRLLWAGQLWLSQLNFGSPLQPQKLQLENPFGVLR